MFVLMSGCLIKVVIKVAVASVYLWNIPVLTVWSLRVTNFCHFFNFMVSNICGRESQSMRNCKFYRRNF